MTHKLCWWCCHSWDGEEYHLPYKINPKTKQKMTMGQFCSWNCMVAYVTDTYNDTKIGTYKSLIASSHKEHTGKLKIPSRAPSKFCLKAFGGTMTIDEFRNVNESNMPTISLPNQVYLVQNVTQNIKLKYNEPSDEQKELKLSSINNTNVKVDTLKLKRSKPLKRESNNLESMIGLKRIVRN